MFQVSEISFCDKKALNIKSDDFKKSIFGKTSLNLPYLVLFAETNIFKLS